MPRGSTSSPYKLRERKQVAFDLFTKGFDNNDVVEKLEVHIDTVKRYREEYEGELQAQMRQNPDLLRNVLGNTIRALDELDLVRQALWEEHEMAVHDHLVTCPECEHEFVGLSAASPATRSNILSQITKAQEQRAKLLGLFGVKAEFLLHVQAIRVLQERIIAFMRNELCSADKVKLEQLLSQDRAHADVSDMPVLEVSSGGATG